MKGGGGREKRKEPVHAVPGESLYCVFIKQ